MDGRAPRRQRHREVVGAACLRQARQEREASDALADAKPLAQPHAGREHLVQRAREMLGIVEEASRPDDHADLVGHRPLPDMLDAVMRRIDRQGGQREPIDLHVAVGEPARDLVDHFLDGGQRRPSCDQALLEHSRQVHRGDTRAWRGDRRLNERSLVPGCLVRKE
jgi:hypothetical protein